MPPPLETDQPPPAPLPAEARERFGLGAVTLLLAGLAALTPLRPGETPLRLVGTLLVLAGILEILHSRRRVSPAQSSDELTTFATLQVTVEP